MKNAFTLIELLVVITILAIIALISMPIVNNVITQSKERTYNEQEKAIVDATKTYITTHSTELPNADTPKCISVAILKNEGLLKNADIKNPVGRNYKTATEYKERDANFNGGVLITYNGVKYIYEYKNTFTNATSCS